MYQTIGSNKVSNHRFLLICRIASVCLKRFLLPMILAGFKDRKENPNHVPKHPHTKEKYSIKDIVTCAVIVIVESVDVNNENLRSCDVSFMALAAVLL